MRKCKPVPKMQPYYKSFADIGRYFSCEVDEKTGSVFVERQHPLSIIISMTNGVLYKKIGWFM